MRFEYTIPVKIVFGNGRINELGKIAKKYGDNVVIITGRKSAEKYGHLEKALNILNGEGIRNLVFNKISPNPKSTEVDEAISLIKENSCNAIIALGGGSAIDAAKAISVGVEYGSIGNLIGGKPLENENSIPVIAIPTTSGSGAEVTKGAIITDTKRCLKSGVRGSSLFPKVAILDPELTHTMPKKATAETGFDALAHAIETYISNKSNPITDLCSEEAMRIIHECLPRAIENGADKEAREKMSLASLLGGMNIANASTCLPHRLQQAMGSIIEITHARGMAALYPAWIKRVSVYRKEKFHKISQILGEKTSHSSVTDFMKRIDIECNLADFADKSDIDKFLEKITGNVENDPIPNTDKQIMREIYEESFY